MTRFRLLWGQEGKFGLPEPQDVGLDADDLAHLADSKEQLFRDFGNWHHGSLRAA
jgi:hypothetical protein